MLYSKFGPTGAVTKIVPVATEQSGCIVTLAVGAAGATGVGSISTSADRGEAQPAASVRVKLYLPVDNPDMVVLAVDPVTAPGLMVQLPESRPVKITLPVVIKQVGCVIVPITGVEGALFTVIVSSFEVAGLPETHVSLEVITTVTLSSLAGM